MQPPASNPAPTHRPPLYLANYRHPGQDAVRCGVVADGLVFPIAAVAPGQPWRTLQDLYEHWDLVAPLLATPLPEPESAIPLDSVALLPPSLLPSSIYFAGFNYRDHVANMQVVFNLPIDPDPKEIGQPPWHNLKPRNTLCATNTTVTLPTPGTDWEIELAVVIGRTAWQVSVADALHHVAGYTVAVDLSARDRAYRPHTVPASVSRMDWIAQKGFLGACPLGPWLTPAHHITDPQDLHLQLSVNNVVKQDSNTAQMIFTVAEAIAHLSSIVPLSPGDIILTGTPAGTGIERGEALQPGDVLHATIAQIGTLTVRFA